jgi:hypothetical protein
MAAGCWSGCAELCMLSCLHMLVGAALAEVQLLQVSLSLPYGSSSSDHGHRLLPRLR